MKREHAMTIVVLSFCLLVSAFGLMIHDKAHHLRDAFNAQAPTLRADRDRAAREFAESMDRLRASVHNVATLPAAKAAEPGKAAK